MPKILILLFASAVLLSACNKPAGQTPSSQNSPDGKKTANFESSTPSAQSVLAGVPTHVVLNFSFDLAAPSSISITQNSTEYGQGRTIIDKNKLAMRRSVDPGAPDGLYTVNYIACWPDGSCHDGSFRFTIDRSLQSGYEDLTGSKEVKIDMKDIMFEPKNIKVARGTTVIWTNGDNVTHYVNTDSHPAHTYEPGQNSKELKPGDTFSYTFENPGIYPYHCSAHASTMTANILVE
jgi:plastocyanin/methionine-rich copper-binding protein CopC